MYLRQPGFSYSVYWLFTSNKEKIQRFKEIENLRYIYQKELDKPCFQHRIGYGELEKQLQIKYCKIKYLIFLKILNITDIKGVSPSGGAIKN